MRIGFDTSGIADLTGVLQRAADRPRKDRAKALDETARRVASEARQIVSGYDKASTGELAGAIEIGGTPVSRTIGAEVRQAFFLEYGSPTTGAPRPWLTGPAQKGADELVEKLGQIGDIW